MKEKHIKARIKQCLAIAECSTCPRRKFGALLLDPVRNVILLDAYNGPPRGGGRLCGGGTCARDTLHIESGTRTEIGCHHAEMNLICNAAAGGVACAGSWLIVTGEPCQMCAKLIHHAGIVKVLVVKGGYLGTNGVQYLRDHGVAVAPVDGPQDPRAKKGGADLDLPTALNAGGSAPSAEGQREFLEVLDSVSYDPKNMPKWEPKS